MRDDLSVRYVPPCTLKCFGGQVRFALALMIPLLWVGSGAAAPLQRKDDVRYAGSLWIHVYSHGDLSERIAAAAAGLADWEALVLRVNDYSPRITVFKDYKLHKNELDSLRDTENCPLWLLTRRELLCIGLLASSLEKRPEAALMFGLIQRNGPKRRGELSFSGWSKRYKWALQQLPDPAGHAEKGEQFDALVSYCSPKQSCDGKDRQNIHICALWISMSLDYLNRFAPNDQERRAFALRDLEEAWSGYGNQPNQWKACAEKSGFPLNEVEYFSSLSEFSEDLRKSVSIGFCNAAEAAFSGRAGKQVGPIPIRTNRVLLLLVACALRFPIKSRHMDKWIERIRILDPEALAGTVLAICAHNDGSIGGHVPTPAYVASVATRTNAMALHWLAAHLKAPGSSPQVRSWCHKQIQEWRKNISLFPEMTALTANELSNLDYEGCKALPCILIRANNSWLYTHSFSDLEQAYSENAMSYAPNSWIAEATVDLDQEPGILRGMPLRVPDLVFDALPGHTEPRSPQEHQQSRPRDELDAEREVPRMETTGTSKEYRWFCRYDERMRPRFCRQGTCELDICQPNDRCFCRQQIVTYTQGSVSASPPLFHSGLPDMPDSRMAHYDLPHSAIADSRLGPLQPTDLSVSTPTTLTLSRADPIGVHNQEAELADRHQQEYVATLSSDKPTLGAAGEISPQSTLHRKRPDGYLQIERHERRIGQYGCQEWIIRSGPDRLPKGSDVLLFAPMAPNTRIYETSRKLDARSLLVMHGNLTLVAAHIDGERLLRAFAKAGEAVFIFCRESRGISAK